MKDEAESPDNIRMICRDCAKEIYNERYTKNDVKVGGNVKACFGGREHMWVKVTRISKRGVYGKVNNIPVLTCSPALGTRVYVTYEEIEDVSEPEP